MNAPAPCPACHGPLTPRVLACASCDIRVEGSFKTSEFGGLPADLMHFLRIFVHCEGRIKDMEKALGVSYPTVKATMTRLKAALGMERGAVEAGAEADADAEAGTKARREPPTDRLAILAAVEKGELTYAEGLSLLKAAPKPKRKTTKANHRGR